MIWKFDTRLHATSSLAARTWIMPGSEYTAFSASLSASRCSCLERHKFKNWRSSIPHGSVIIIWLAPATLEIRRANSGDSLPALGQTFKTPKSRNGKRTISLPPFALRAHTAPLG
jgi:hypothetical protein